MNPAQNIIAVKAPAPGNAKANQVQVFNLDSKQKLGDYISTELIQFWRWLTPQCLALVGETTVYHWTLESNSTKPKSVFERGGRLAQPVQIIGYAASHDASWCLLTGIYAVEASPTIKCTVRGCMQLYNSEKKQQQFLEGTGGVFDEVMIDQTPGGKPSSILAFAECKKDSSQIKLHVMELGPRSNGTPPLKVNGLVYFPPENENDFIISVQICSKFGVIYLVSKGGRMYLFDLHTANQIFQVPLVNDTIFAAVASPESGTLTCVSKQGHVLKIAINPFVLPDSMATQFLLDRLKGNNPEDAQMQTKLFEMTLMNNPAIAESLFQMEQLTHYNKQYIGELCEKVGMPMRALENYTDMNDIKRVLGSVQNISGEWLNVVLSRLSPDVIYECLLELLKNNRQNMSTVVQCAVQFHSVIGINRLIELFESRGSYDGVYFLLGSIVNTSNDAEVHFKYIEVAAKLGYYQEVERVCRESKVYDAQRVKEFLKTAKLPDPRSLIYVCDLHGFVDELTQYLYKNSLMKYIEVYVCKVNPMNGPMVIATLIDLDCSEDFIKGLLQNVRGNCPVKPLVEEVESRNRLKLLLPWLEARVAEGNQEPELHNAMGKLCVDINRDPESFLKTNMFYDSAVLGSYCEARDPHLAYIAYKRAWGSCDEALVRVTNEHGLYRLQAKYLVERQSEALWSTVLDPGNSHRRAVMDQVVSSALPESKNADELSVTVKAFMSADMPNELIELLERIVLHSSDFSNNKNLQNLLILTAIKADRSRVIDYINRLDNYDGPDIAKIALGEQYQLYEEAFTIYKKFSLHSDAIEVLLSNMDNLTRAAEFAARINDKDTWAKLGKAQLEADLVPDAIESYLKADNPNDYSDVIEAAEREENYSELVKYLHMCRKYIKDQLLDTELVYALAKSDQLAIMEDFITGGNTANVQAVGDRLFEEQNYKAAKILFQSIPNNSKLASCYVHMGEFAQAIEAAKKANNPRSWKEVTFACVDAREFRSATIAGAHIIVHPDHLDSVIHHFEVDGFYEEMILLLEAGLGSDRSHVGMYTELGILYAKYKGEKIMEFIKIYAAKFNIPKVIKACERHRHWTAAVFLHQHYGEYDNAANLIITHPSCWDHDRFVAVMQNVANNELYYRVINFYLEEHAELLDSLLTGIAGGVDHARVVQQVKKAGHLPLIEPYLQKIQVVNVAAVNDALNELYAEEQNHDKLRQSTESYENFDQLSLAHRLEKDSLLQFRRISCLLYKKNKKFKQSIELSKGDKMYQDAMETARDSGDVDVAEGLLNFFVEIEDRESFAACLYVCYNLIRPDTALELAWKARCVDYVMPYMIQVVREYSYRVDALDKKIDHREEEALKEKSAPNDFVADFVPVNGSLGFGNSLALMPPPGGMGGPCMSGGQMPSEFSRSGFNHLRGY
eukprot:GHVL01035078.1.p1 GENE.GHVL01035078.1~~GHVL01035078.1.p1  ORF type:complete len:1411 (+),score=249.62 GHVL01035078.1:264-4496(+)